MFEMFCEETGLRGDVRLAMERSYREHQDLPLRRSAIQACFRQDQEALSTVLSQGLDWYGPVYPLVLLGLCHEIIRQFYPDETIRRETLSDIAVWESWYERRHGTIGLDRVGWVVRHACGHIWRLGRLQFEWGRYPFSQVINRDKDGRYHVTDTPLPDLTVVGKPGMDSVRIHIPQGGPLLPSEVDASLRQAASFFPWATIAVCDSWLLDPTLAHVCQDSPNIRSFQRRFTTFPIPQQGEPQIFERVFFFGARREDVLSYQCTTSLQRRIQDAVRRGVTFRTTGGFVELVSPA